MWEVLSLDLLDLIVRKLSYPDAVRFSAVCTSWLQAAKTSRVFSQPLLLHIPAIQKCIRAEEESNRLNLQLRSLEEGKLSTAVADVVVSLTERYRKYDCIGSSKGMLVLLNRKMRSEIVLLDPFSQEIFQVPPFSVLNLVRTTYVMITKVVILEMTRHNIILAVVYRHSWAQTKECAYCRVGARLWETLCQDRFYSDMVAQERRLFLLSDCNSVEAWDFVVNSTDRPKKVISFVPSKIIDRWPSLHHVYLFQWESNYLVESVGELFLVRRLTILSNDGTVKTVDFRVYKSRLSSGEEWERVESLGDDRAFFLGMNESVSLSSSDDCKGNSIYFIDRVVYSTRAINFEFAWCDNYKDMGVFCMKQKNIKYFQMHEDDDHKFYQPPTWIFRT